MTDCLRAEIRDLLPDLLHEHLDDAVRAEVMAHVASCDECRAELELLRTARSALVRTSSVNTERVAHLLRAAPRKRRRPVPAWALPIAASLMLLLTGAMAIAILGYPGGRGVVTAEDEPPVSPNAPLVAEGGSPPAAPPSGVAPAGAPFGDLVMTADAGLFIGGLSDLEDAELEAMLGALEALDVFPAEEPPPMVQGIEITEG